MSLPTPTELVTPPTPDPVRPIERTQATPPSNSPVFDETGRISNLRRNEETGELFDPGPHAYQQPGAGAPPEDSGTPSISSNFSEANFAYNNLIKPRPNILDNYASYTYNFSFFMLTPEQLADLFEFGRADTGTWSLLMQSGGAGDSKRDQAPNGAPAGRNKYFTNDFYIDNVEIRTALNGTTGTTVNFTDLAFSIYEPNGITLLACLQNAFNDLMKNNKTDTGLGTANTATAFYCLVLRFYGYDDTGKLVYVGTDGTAPAKIQGSDPRAIVEKYFPFVIHNITFKTVSKGEIEYRVTGAFFSAIPGQTNRGTVKTPGTLVGETVGDLLSGPRTKAETNSQGERVDSPSVPQSFSNAPDASTARESVAGYSNLF